MMKQYFIILFSTLSLLFSGIVLAEDTAAEEYMEANYGPDKSKWPIWDTPPSPINPSAVEVEVGTVTDPNHGKNILDRRMGGH